MTARRLRRALSPIGLLACWQLAASSADSLLVPTPALVVTTLWDGIASGLIWEEARPTFERGLVGFLIAVIVGVSLGLTMARSRVVRAMFEPVLAATYPVPRLALYPVLILILGLGAASEITLVALECAYPITYSAYAGARSIDKRVLWTARNAGAGSLRVLYSVVFKASLPAILAGLRIALPIMLVVVVVVEIVSGSVGLGFLIRSAGAEFEPEGALAVVLLLGIVGYALDRLMVSLTRVVVFWERGVRL